MPNGVVSSYFWSPPELGAVQVSDELKAPAVFENVQVEASFIVDGNEITTFWVTPVESANGLTVED